MTDDMEADYARLRAAGYDGFRSRDHRHPLGAVPRRSRLPPARPGRDLDRADGGTAGWSGLERVGEAGHEGRSGRGVRGPVPGRTMTASCARSASCASRRRTASWAGARPSVARPSSRSRSRSSSSDVSRPWSWAAIRATCPAPGPRCATRPTGMATAALVSFGDQRDRHGPLGHRGQGRRAAALGPPGRATA